MRFNFFGTSLTAMVVMAIAVTGCGPQADFGPVANAKTGGEIRAVLVSNEAAAGGGGAAAATGTGWATLKGRFVFDGTPPTMAPYA